MNFTEVFIVCVVIACVLMFIRGHYAEVEVVKAATDGRSYIVRRLPDRQKAADMLGDLNNRLTHLVRHMLAKYPGDADVERLQANYNPEAVSEGGTEVGYTSYSVNKGEKIVMCLRNRDNSFVDVNVVMYVAVHELGHLMTAEVGHGDTFWANFKRLAEEAVAIGVYQKTDFAMDPAAYCGMTITSSVV